MVAPIVVEARFLGRRKTCKWYGEDMTMLGEGNQDFWGGCGLGG